MMYNTDNFVRSYLLSRYYHIDKSGKSVTGPYSIHISPCDRCNYDCLFCWNHRPEVDSAKPSTLMSNFLHIKPTVMEFELFRRIIDDLSSIGTHRFELWGKGEPLINPKIVDMVKYIKSADGYCCTTTNGSLLTKEKATSLFDAGLDSLGVSISAGSPDSYKILHPNSKADTFYRIKSVLMDASEKAYECSTKVELTHVITTFNCHEIPEMIQYASDCGASHMILMPVWTDGQLDSLIPTKKQRMHLHQMREQINKLSKKNEVSINYDDYLDKLSLFDQPCESKDRTRSFFKNHRCTVGYKFCTILADGRVLPCSPSDLVFGNLSSRSFLDIWNSKEYSDFRRRGLALPISDKPIPKCSCFNCDHVPIV